jgi:cbb3-type cytochrome oxidase subunit 3
MIFDIGLIYTAFNYTIGAVLGLVTVFFCAVVLYVIWFMIFNPKPKTPEEYAAEMERKAGDVMTRYGE